MSLNYAAQTGVTRGLIISDLELKLLKIFPSVQFAEPTFQDRLSSSKKTFLKSTDLHESFIILSKICYGNEKKKTFQQNLLFLPLFFPGLFISPFFFISSLFARAISLGFTTDLVSKYSTTEASSSVSLQNNWILVIINKAHFKFVTMFQLDIQQW